MKKLLLPAFFALVTSAFAKVEVFEISKNNVDLLPQGKEADGIIGDFVIRNTLIECLIGGSADNRKANMGAFWGADGVTPGCLYDLCLRGSKNDQLTIFSPSRQQGKVSYVRPSPGGNGVEVVVSSALSALVQTASLPSQGERGRHNDRHLASQRRLQACLGSDQRPMDPLQFLGKVRINRVGGLRRPIAQGWLCLRLASGRERESGSQKQHPEPRR